MNVLPHLCCFPLRSIYVISKTGIIKEEHQIFFQFLLKGMLHQGLKVKAQ